jgi:hypothetical protein
VPINYEVKCARLSDELLQATLQLKTIEGILITWFTEDDAYIVSDIISAIRKETLNDKFCSTLEIDEFIKSRK